MNIFARILTVLMVLALMSCSDSSTGPGGDGNNTSGEYVVFAWNDLGMHCLNPTYDQAIILPPFNTVWAQVVRRGNPPTIVTAGVSVRYAIEINTYSYGKREYGQFWDTAGEVFGPLLGFDTLAIDVGLTGMGLSGEMHAAGDHFVAEGIPVTPVTDTGDWRPYQTAVITVRGQNGDVIASTKATVPVSDEINCSKCHGSEPWRDLLEDHDRLHQTTLASSTPLLCASCHGSPVLGTSGPGSSGIYLSKAIHGAHADRGSLCYDCHPGNTSLCNRSVRHTSQDGNCITCHGTMGEVASSIPGSRIPWVGEPACSDCHSGVAGVLTDPTLYRNANGHGGVYCAGCHGSPHAMYPSYQAMDNHQPLQYQGFTGRVKTIGSCGVCHQNSRGGGEEGEEEDEFAEEHGGASPRRSTGCNICHTSVPSETAKWPHAYQWRNSNTN